jgi:hypothetical protein
MNSGTVKIEDECDALELRRERDSLLRPGLRRLLGVTNGFEGGGECEREKIEVAEDIPFADKSSDDSAASW